MKSLLREPLVHFLLLGGLLFTWFEWRGGAGGPDSTRIVVTPGQIQHLASGFARTWQRPATEAELKGLVDDYVKEEIAVREAMAAGLDRDDTVIRRRLRQKMEFLVEEASGQAPPTDAEIRAWADAHPDAFGAEPQISFRQVFVSAQRRGAAAPGEARKILARLRADGSDTPNDELGDPTMLPPEQPLGPLREVTRIFGSDFAQKVAAIEPGQWAGPVESTFGLHLVLVRERATAAPPDLATIRPVIERDLLAERSKTELSALYERLLKKYEISIEMPKPAEVNAAAGSAR